MNRHADTGVKRGAHPMNTPLHLSFKGYPFQELFYFHCQFTVKFAKTLDKYLTIKY